MVRSKEGEAPLKERERRSVLEINGADSSKGRGLAACLGQVLPMTIPPLPHFLNTNRVGHMT